MRTNKIVIEKEIGTVKTGWLIDQNRKVELNQLLPYISKPEDIEVTIRNNALLKNNQPLEVNGFYIKQLLGKAVSLQGELIEPYIKYSELTFNHPPLISFPSEVVWLNNSDGLDGLETNMVWLLQKECFGYNKGKSEKLANMYVNLIKNSSQTYDFWEAIISQKFESETLSKLLIDWTIELALQAKMRYLAGLVPVIDSKTNGSITLSHRVNIAYGNIIEDRYKNGLDVPKYFYTIALNSSMINPNDWSKDLQAIIQNTTIAIHDTELFDGIHITVRGLSRISNDSGRVAVLLNFISKLNKIAQDNRIPIWWSRSGLIGLGLLDEGAHFASFSLNMGIEDVFSSFAKKDTGKPSPDNKYGRILNPHMKQIQSIRDVIKLQHGLPKIEGFRNKPTDSEIKNSTTYRKNFAKPYNLAVMNHLNKQWLENINKGETKPGREYLQKFDSPRYYSSWGLS